MTTLHDRLADLAGQAPAPAATPAELWARGRRYQRRRRAGTLAVLACALLVLGGLGGVARHRADPPDRVVPAGSVAGLPDRLHAPSAWLPGTEDDGPLGPLAAVVSTVRRSWTGSSNGLVGVSTAGTYRFLDLPDADPELIAEAALAPDGRHVAYWYGGATVGLAVYDTSTAEVRRSRVRAADGLFTVQPPSWTGPGTVVFQPTWRTGPDAGQVGRVQAWRLRDAGPHRSGDRAVPGPAAGVVDPAGTRVAVLADANNTPSRLLVGPVTGADPRAVPGLEASRVDGWVDEQHVAVEVDTRLVSVDVTTGSQRTLVDGTGGGAQFAAGLLGAPTYAAPAPPTPLDPRLLTLLVLLVAGAAGLTLRWWRRRVRP